MSEKNSPTDDDRQTPSNIDENSSETISNQSTETLSIQNERSTPLSHIRIRPVKVENLCILPNLTIKHPNRIDESDPFITDDKRIIDDKHVKVSRIDRSALPHLTTDLSLLRMNTYARRKSNGTIVVSLPNKRISSQISHDKQSLSRQNTVRINRISTTESTKQDARQKCIPSKIKENVIHVSIKRKTTT